MPARKPIAAKRPSALESPYNAMMVTHALTMPASQALVAHGVKTTAHVMTAPSVLQVTTAMVERVTVEDGVIARTSTNPVMKVAVRRPKAHAF